MRREDKYPETDTFVYYNANPKGRVTGDCVFRAFSSALKQPYNDTLMEMAKLQCETGYALNDSKGEEAYLKSKGVTKLLQPKRSDGTKYTGVQFCEFLNRFKNIYSGKRIVAHIGGHHMTMFAEKDGKFKVHDIWDCTDGCVGNWWVCG